MRLTVNNIDFVKELTEDGISYNWFVAMKSGRICDSIHYAHYDKDRRTIVKEIKKEDLPKTVQKFIDTHERMQFEKIDARHYCYIYK